MKYQDLIDACRQDWQEYTEHAFRAAIGQSTLGSTLFSALLETRFLIPKTVRASLCAGNLQSTYVRRHAPRTTKRTLRF
ncbi:putative transcriptional activator [Vibrio parahaemolyticus]|nr:putative transcriptional activator [Vibrio parahaemolyticus]